MDTESWGILVFEPAGCRCPHSSTMQKCELRRFWNVSNTCADREARVRIGARCRTTERCTRAVLCARLTVAGACQAHTAVRIVREAHLHDEGVVSETAHHLLVHHMTVRHAAWHAIPRITCPAPRMPLPLAAF